MMAVLIPRVDRQVLSKPLAISGGAAGADGFSKPPNAIRSAIGSGKRGRQCRPRPG
jgi:hypothetical protein